MFMFVVKVGTISLKVVVGTEGTAPRLHLREKPSRKRCFSAMTRSVYTVMATRWIIGDVVDLQNGYV